jgi:hypothetical protein
MMRQEIIELFEISGRGTVAVVAQPTDLPVGKVLQAKIICPDGSYISAEAFKEWLLRRSSPTTIEHEAYLLRDITKNDVPSGASIEIAAISNYSFKRTPDGAA